MYKLEENSGELGSPISVHDRFLSIVLNWFSSWQSSALNISCPSKLFTISFPCSDSEEEDEHEDW